MAATINASSSSGIVTTADNSAQLELQTGNTTAITVNSSQNVGIGTTNPNVKLDVIGSIEASAAATQDAIILAGRAGGTSSHAVTLTPTTLTASRTVTLPDADINFTNGLGVAQGGTGQTTYTDGQLLIGNSTGNTLTKATITAGSGITVTNGSGAITIAASGGGGFSNMQVFASPGTFTTPASTTRIKVTVVGGGGNGGNGGSTGSPAQPSTGGRGGAGAVAIYVGPVTASTPYAVTVGTATNTSSFGPIVSCTGGASGTGVPSISNGSGGTATGGTLNIPGAPGGVQLAGGSTMFGVGGGPRNPQVAATANATGYGAGGGGGSGLTPAPTVPAGAGRPGLVIVEW